MDCDGCGLASFNIIDKQEMQFKYSPIDIFN